MRTEVLEERPEVATLLTAVTDRLDNEVIRSLNARVDIDGEEPALVALDWLRDEGLVR